jgi:HD-GYP domain-containing protein (c-di-GMP phosphodiesterase class II)
VLRQVAKVMLDGKGERDAQCRYGGEEFVWLLPGADREYVVQRGEWLRRAVEETEIPTAEGTFRVTISVGASTYQFRDHGRLSAASLLDCADAALLEAKKQGKNRVVFREPVMENLGPTGDAAAHGGSDAAERVVFPPPRPEVRRHRAALRVLMDAAESPETDAYAQQELRALLLGSIKVLTEVLAARDREIMTHCHRVASTAVAIAMELELPPEEIERIKLASMIHDIGKLAIPEVILRKPSPLSPAEWQLVRQHPERGAAMLADAEPFSRLADLVLYHQESYDGTGYPDGLAGAQIPLGARIIRVSDTFDALISDRPYRPRKSLEEAKAELRRMAGTTLDPGVVDTLLRLLETMSPLERELIMRRDRDLLADPSPPGGAAPDAR